MKTEISKFTFTQIPCLTVSEAGTGQWSCAQAEALALLPDLAAFASGQPLEGKAVEWEWTVNGPWSDAWCTVGGLTLSVIWDYGPWILYFGDDSIELKAKTLEAAQLEALAIVRLKLAEALAACGPEVSDGKVD